MPDIEMIPRIRFAEIPVCVGEVKLSMVWAKVISGNNCRTRAKLKKNSPAYIIKMKVAPQPGDGNLEFVVTNERRRTNNGVVDRMLVRCGVIHIEEEFPREDL